MRLNMLTCLAIALILTGNALGLGVAPSKTLLEYKADIQEGAMRIIVDQVPSKIIMTKEGELGKYIELEKDVMIAEQEETWVKFKVRLPKDLPPGERSGGIMVLQIPKDSGQQDMVMAAPAVMHNVKVNVPYPGKYLAGKVFITNIKLNEPIDFTIAAANYGLEKIESAKATIVIKGPTNQEVATLHTDTISIEGGKETKLLTSWTTENAGSYVAEAAIEYDGKMINLAERFDVGNEEIGIEKIEVGNFRIGSIAKLDIYLVNRWNSQMKVDGRTEVFKDKKLVSSFNTIPVDILEKSSGIMNAYWNTEGIEPGTYDISVKLSYNGKTTEKTFSSLVSLDNIAFKDFVSGKVSGNAAENTRTTILTMAVFLLILFNIGLFIYIRNKLKSKTN